MEDLNLGMFKSYDIRTKESKLDFQMKKRLVSAVVRYYGEVLKVKSVVICRDARLHVPELAELLRTGMNNAGMDVLINPLPVSTCQFYFTCMKNRGCGAVMLTASHNPMEYVGMKLMAPQVLPLAYGYGPEGGIEKIKSFYLENKPAIYSKVKGRTIVINELENYIDYSMELAGVTPGSLSGLKVMFEFLNGSAGTEEMLAFQKAGADVTACNLVPDGFFPNGDPNPIIETSIAPARKFMQEGDFDLGFCFDGDGDRMDLMDRNGNQIVPGLNMAILMPNLVSIYGGEKKEFYADVKAVPTSLVEIAKAGVNIHIIRNGHSFIKAKLRDNCDKGYFASEEESAHYYVNLPFDSKDFSKGFAAVESTLFFALLTARSFKQKPEAYDRAMEIQERTERVKEWPLYCDGAPEKMPEILEKIEKRMVELGASVTKDMDDGSDLDATLLRFNLPRDIDADTDLENTRWSQVALRISRSEDAMARFEVVSNCKEDCLRFNDEIVKITDIYVKSGAARY